MSWSMVSRHVAEMLPFLAALAALLMTVERPRLARLMRFLVLRDVDLLTAFLSRSRAFMIFEPTNA